MKKSNLISLSGFIILFWLFGCSEIEPGPLIVSKINPRYFTNGSGKAIYLTGSHTWNNLVDMSPSDPLGPFDFNAYLKWMKEYNHNFFRLWTWELINWDTSINEQDTNENKVHTIAPHPYGRTGPGNALDGKPKFNLKQFNSEYFNRLRSRVETASDSGIYASIMLFEGWGLQHS